MHLVQVVFLQKQMRGKYTAMVVWRRQTVLRPPDCRRSGLIKSLSIDITTVRSKPHFDAFAFSTARQRHSLKQ